MLDRTIVEKHCGDWARFTFINNGCAKSEPSITGSATKKGILSNQPSKKLQQHSHCKVWMDGQGQNERLLNPLNHVPMRVT